MPARLGTRRSYRACENGDVCETCVRSGLPEVERLEYLCGRGVIHQALFACDNAAVPCATTARQGGVVADNSRFE